MDFPIFRDEIDAGLAELIASHASVAYCSQLVPSEQIVLSKTIAEKLTVPEFAVAGSDDWDLYPYNSLMVSIGWNANDDVFIPEETWGARYTPIYKPVSFMHDETKIIGAIINRVTVDVNGKVIADSDITPEAFDIIVASVLYAKWSDVILQQNMDKLIAEIKTGGKWWVSMECLFRHFDYAVQTASGEHKIVPRNADSAFLTKYLRVYGGSGEFDGNRLGRLLRNFVFSGKGIVDNPANKRSVIFDKTKFNPFTATQASINIFKRPSIITVIPQEYNMSDSNDLVSRLREDLAQAQARSDKLETKLQEMVGEAMAAQRQVNEKVVAELKVDVEDLTKEVESLKAKCKEKDEQIEKDKADVKAVSKELVEAKEKLATSEAAEIKSARMAQLITVGATSDEATELAGRWSSANNEQFGDVVKLFSEKHMMKHDDEEDKKKKGKKEDSEESDANEKNADVKVEDAKATESDTNASTDKGTELCKAAANWVNSLLKTSRKLQSED